MADDIRNPAAPFGTVARIIELLEQLTVQDREHVLRTVATWFRVGLTAVDDQRPSAGSLPAASPVNAQEDDKFSNRPVLSVKDFIFEKNPATDSERLACLDYYLTHYMETPHFKTVDLTRLNTEAAQRGFSNPSVASSNAIRDGFFVSASKEGYKQLSAMGERFVHALPDREAAQLVRQRIATRHSRRGSNNQGSLTATEPEGQKI